MESIIITITGLLLLYSSFGANFNVGNIISKVSAGESYKFPYHLALAKPTSFPYRLRGVPNFNANDITAGGAIVADEETGRILFEKDSYDKKSLASLTKLMTALIWWEVDGNLEKTIEIKSEDYREGGIAYFIAGEQVKAKDLLNAGLIASSNSAMATLVRSTGKTEEDFIALMNKKAEALGMYNTRFKEPTGLDFKNISVASDIFILAREVFKNPILASITQKESYSFIPIGKSVARNVQSTDWLLSEKNSLFQVVGGKTGYIEESDYNFVLKARSNEGRNIIVVLLGSADKGTRFEEAKKLVNWAFNNYIWKI
ncbi:serine hydrolase [Candidatus Parcubacteria bacterium]|nr:serine hydrolase [Patescibacteria group bacterium]MCG2694132.1 serine hydrolase [Candidatus Parcubacteria bacterium]